MNFRPTCTAGFAIALLTALSACSNGRGSVDERATAPASEVPALPTPQPETPTPQPEQPPAPPPPTVPPAPPPEPVPAPQPPAQPPDQPPLPTPVGSALAGFWRGTARDTDSGQNSDATAFIDQFGEMQLMVGTAAVPEFVIYGNLCCEPTLDDSVGALRYLRTNDDETDLKARLSGGKLVGEFDYRGKHEFSLSAQSSYRQALTLQGLAGVYTSTESSSEGAQTLTLAITVDGELTGSHSNGCVYNGRVSIPNPQRNMVRLNVRLDSCGGRRTASSERWNGQYSGLGTVLRQGASSVLFHSMRGPTWLGPESPER